ncbi:ArsR/SmtB family transcription factor [Longirhabdus pacifica]|uniref:ArsR/SmtB family transcription factor n=1 Tax=Longirhabdus pacifica TaxID=2305227 RepID=UPI001008F6A6|nr:metalloregulator ArsR/SmtB family transcription factor [Longirhabdus pacifica]
MKQPYQPPMESIPFTRVMQALSEPNRVKIVQFLLIEKEKICSSFIPLTNLPKSSVSHHIKVLRESGLIQARVEGKEHYYSVRVDELEARFPGIISTLSHVDPAYI